MASAILFISFLLASLAVLHSGEEDRLSKRCPPYLCNDEIGNISFPFKYKQYPSECGLYSVDCTEKNLPLIQLSEGDQYWHGLISISATNNISLITNKNLKLLLETNPCDDQIIEDLNLPRSSPISEVSAPNNLIVFKCLDYQDTNSSTGMRLACTSDYPYHYYIISSAYVPSLPPGCSVILLPFLPGWNLSNQRQNISVDNFSLQVTVSEECLECHDKGDICNADNGEFICQTLQGENLKLKLGLCIGLGVLALLAAGFLMLWCYRHKYAADSDLEESSVYLGVSIFTYKELEEATDHFNSDKQIGDGGFGVVYYGKLKDGREVAVKRLYEHNYRRAEQFINEIEILTHLRHKNLVTLYGCSSLHSRDLILVYEYIPKGTVADHLHGDRAATGSTTWPIRMSIARETASALCYLHASDIVHRDVKTTNILLDDNFTVKVSDFGTSRFFPLDVTHVSTAPQGTPGYVDPEYHKCYQLTPKSDVYSFGVVLIELISSLPAVDITRHKEEINLSNIAINRIENGLYDELMDASLGFESDHEAKRMAIAVADLAFQCLQQNSDARPTMSEVLEALKKIESRNEAPKNLSAAFFDAEIGKSMQLSPSSYSDRIQYTKAQSSPNSVTQTWTSSNSTVPNVSA